MNFKEKMLSMGIVLFTLGSVCTVKPSVEIPTKIEIEEEEEEEEEKLLYPPNNKNQNTRIEEEEEYQQVFFRNKNHEIKLVNAFFDHLNNQEKPFSWNKLGNNFLTAVPLLSAIGTGIVAAKNKSLGYGIASGALGLFSAFNKFGPKKIKKTDTLFTRASFDVREDRLNSDWKTAKKESHTELMNFVTGKEEEEDGEEEIEGLIDFQPNNKTTPASVAPQFALLKVLTNLSSIENYKKSEKEKEKEKKYNFYNFCTEATIKIANTEDYLKTCQGKGYDKFIGVFEADANNFIKNPGICEKEEE